MTFQERTMYMDQKSMIEDLISQLDAGMSKGVGHINVNVDDEADSTKEVQTLGCTDCSRTPLACSVPTLQQGLDDYR